ncbi:MAG: hypothetical protein ACJA08_000185 [Cyclobacteriaceae bacterium]|jgi:hypothetical protein
MSINQHIEELTDQYLRGELSGSGLQSFEQQMLNDPAMKQHVVVQQQIIQGISNYRHTQLKARLDAIQMGTGWFGSGVLGEGIIKIAGSTIAVAIIGGGIYYTWPDNENNIPFEDRLELTDGKSFSYLITEIPELPFPQTLQELGETETTSINLSKSESTIATSVSPVHKSGTSTLEIVDTKSNETVDFVPKVNIPTLNDVTADKEFIAQDVSIPEASDNDIIDESDKKPIDIKTFNRTSEEIKYKFFDGKLFLYGDFKKQPYEILEINSKSSRQIYLYYTDKYYHVEVTDDVKSLRPIFGDKLINELRIIRNNKLN